MMSTLKTDSQTSNVTVPKLHFCLEKPKKMEELTVQPMLELKGQT